MHCGSPQLVVAGVTCGDASYSIAPSKNSGAATPLVPESVGIAKATGCQTARSHQRQKKNSHRRGGDAAVDDDGLAGHEARGVGGKIGRLPSSHAHRAWRGGEALETRAAHLHLLRPRG